MIDLSRKDWTVMARTEGGSVGITRNLTLAEAAKCKKMLMPPRTGVWESSTSDVVGVSVFGPEGWDGCLGGESHDFSQLTCSHWAGDSRNGVRTGDAICFGHCPNCGEHFWMVGDRPT